jgi:hypothetical protein
MMSLIILRKRVSFIFFFGMLQAYQANAQAPQLVKLTPPSPNVAAFQKYGDIPVSAYTGIPNISIPIYTVKFRDITVPISISYHASGIKVAEEASQVGLGWTLNAGGNISRNIMGADDFLNNAYFNGTFNTAADFSGRKGPNNYTPTGCVTPMWNNSGDGNPTLFNYDASADIANSPEYDFQPDQYYYNFQNKSGKFALSRLKKVFIQKQENIAINVTATDGSTWQIISDDGYIYDFAAVETFQDGVPLQTHFSAWYLTKITSPGGSIVTFSYITNANLVTSVGSYSESRDDYDRGVGGVFSTSLGSSSGYTPGKNYSNKLLSSIDFGTGRVVFSYSANRPDLAGEKRLDSISVYNAGEVTPIKTYSLIYDVFTGTNDPSYNTSGGLTTYISQRLKLTQVAEKGYNNGQYIQAPPYIFTYNENNSAPAKTSFARDHWGYFNGVTGRTTLIPDVLSVNSTDLIASILGLNGIQRETNPYWAPIFNIKSIKYPTGGWTDFEFESNDFDEEASQVNDHSYFNLQNNTAVQKTQMVAYDALSRTYSGTNVIDLTNEYVADGGGSPFVNITASWRFNGGTGANCNDVGITNPGYMYFELKNSSGTVLSHIDPGGMLFCTGTPTSTCTICPPNSPVLSYTTTYQLPPGVYTWTAFVGNSGPALKLQDMRCNFSWYEIAANGSNANTITTGGGLRIKRIIDHDGIDERNNKIKKYDYHYLADKTGSGTPVEYSYGRRMSKPQYADFKMSIDDYSQQTPTGCNNNIFYSYHLTRTSDSNIPLNGSASGAVVGYDKVTEFLGDNGEYGKTVYEYINQPDNVSGYNEQYSVMNLPMKPPYASNIANPLNGSVTRQTQYVNLKESFFKAAEEINEYNTVAANQNFVYGFEKQVLPSLLLGDKCNSVIVGPCDVNTMLLWYRALQSEWNYLSKKTAILYNEKGDEQHYQQTITDYYYDNPNHLQLTRTVTKNSKGEETTSTLRYPQDFTVPTGSTDAFAVGVKNLQNKHVVNQAVEAYVNKKNPDGSSIGTTSAFLSSFGASLPKPALAYSSQIAGPNASFVPSSISSTTGLVKDNTYQPLIYFDNYDNSNGNLKQQHKVNDVNLSYLWDYSNSQMIAEVQNAAVNEIAYTSFEADGSGNWTIPSTVRTAGATITGRQYYTMTATAITASVPNTKPYTVSYWSKNGALTVNGVAATQGPTKGLWTYYQHSLAAGTASVTVTGSGINIDELRLYPKDAQMATYTFMPLIGVTSICAGGNSVVYYLYDGLGRLEFIKDWDGNILKTYEYNFTGTVVQ